MPRPNDLGLSREDVARIQALAESLDPLDGSTPALTDLSVPIRVVAVHKGEESRFSGEVLGEWAGRSILFWRMTNRERERRGNECPLRRNQHAALLTHGR